MCSCSARKHVFVLNKRKACVCAEQEHNVFALNKNICGCVEQDHVFVLSLKTCVRVEQENMILDLNQVHMRAPEAFIAGKCTGFRPGSNGTAPGPQNPHFELFSASYF